MPIATIKTMKGALTNEQKIELHRKFADLMVEIEGKGNEDIRILMSPSTYSKFKPEDWWKEGRYSLEVLGEYGKLIYNSPKYF